MWSFRHSTVTVAITESIRIVLVILHGGRNFLSEILQLEVVEKLSCPASKQMLKSGNKNTRPMCCMLCWIGWKLTLSWRRFLSYRNQSTDLLSKSMDWFLYDRNLRHERVNIKDTQTASTETLGVHQTVKHTSKNLTCIFQHEFTPISCQSNLLRLTPKNGHTQQTLKLMKPLAPSKLLQCFHQFFSYQAMFLLIYRRTVYSQRYR